MSQYTTMETPGGIIWVELGEQTKDDRPQPANTQRRALALATFGEVLDALKVNAKKALDTAVELGPSEVEVSFGITTGAEGGNTFFGLAKVSGEANYTITLKWKSSVDSANRAADT